MPPRAEAINDSVYFFGRMQLPGTLAVYETSYTWDRDGRRLNEPIPVLDQYGGFVIVDKHGIIRYVSIGDPVLEETLLARFIERLLAE